MTTVDATSSRPVRVSRSEAAPLRLGVVALGGLGGSGRVAWDIAQGLSMQGHRVVRVTSRAPHWRASPQDVVTRSSSHVPHAPQAAQAEWVRALAEDIRDAVLQHELEALSVHYGIGLVEAAISARDRLPAHTTSRVFATLHGTDVEMARIDGQQRARLTESLERCDAVTAVSNWLADEAMAVLGLKKRPLVIRNAVDTDLFSPRISTLRPPFTLVHASNFRAVKRPLDCLEVLAKVRQAGCNAQLLMTGDGPLLPAALEHARALGLDEHVEFSPPVDRPTLARQLQGTHVCLVTSENESFGLVALEAMACGVPFVGTRCGGLRELLASMPGDLEDMLLAPVGDVDALADRVCSLLADPVRYEAICTRGIGTARGFDRAEQLRAYVELFSGSGAGA